MIYTLIGPFNFLSVFLWMFVPLFVGINLSIYSSFVAGERCTEV